MSRRCIFVVVNVLGVAFVFASSTAAQFAPSGGPGLHGTASSGAEEDVMPASAPNGETAQEQKTPEIAGFEKGNFNGFYVQSRDEEFRLNIGAYSQFRYNLVWRETPPTGETRFLAGFVVPRTRFFFEGRFTAAIEYQLRMNIDDGGAFSIQIAYAGYNFKNYRDRSSRNQGVWNLRVGRQFVAVMREDWMYAQDLLTTEFSSVDQAFAVGTSDGAQVFFGKDRYRLWFAVTNGALGAKEDFPNNLTSQVLLSGRGEVQLVGEDWSTFDDLVGRKGRSFGVLLGVGAGYARRGPNAPVETPKHAGQITVDVSAGGNGFQAMAAGVWTAGANESTESTWGLLAQGGYFIFEPWQVYAQYQLVDPGRLPDLVSFHALVLGTNLFPFTWTNRYKLSVEGGLLFSAINETLIAPNPLNGWLTADAGNQYYLRAQLQLGF